MNAIIRIPETNKSNAPNTEPILIDSGASISILHQRNSFLFDDITPIDETTIIFGNSKVNLDVYEVEITIKGDKFSLITALAKSLNFKYSILGYHQGIEKFDIFVMKNTDKIFKLIKKP